MEKIYKSFGGYDMSYDEIKQLCRKSWEDEYSYLCIDMSKTRHQGRYSICNGSQNTYFQATPETNSF